LTDPSAPRVSVAGNELAIIDYKEVVQIRS